MATPRWKPALLALCLAALAAPVAAQVQTRAYAPENLRTLSLDDQVRVISLEYQEQSGGRQIPQDQLRFYLDQVNRSDWGFSQIRADIGQSLGGGAPQPPVGGDTVRCESSGGARICRVPWSGPSRLVQQLSSAPCDEGRTWQSQNRQVYVGNGCRGVFAAASALPAPGQAVRCESVGNRAQLCNVSWTGPSRLSRQLPGSTGCTEGRTWQSQNGRVYVGGGCRAEFVAAAQTKPMPLPAPVAEVVCASNDYRPVSCAWPSGARAPRLIEQLSRNPCTQGRTWGFSGSAIWVSQGCRGRFGE